jgi:hypothetical protein
MSMTANTLRVVLVEGAKADGVLIEQATFHADAIDSSANSGAFDRVIDAVLGTQEGAIAAGQHLAAIGVAWSDETQAAALRETLDARGLDDVLVVSELHAAAALAQAVGRTLDYSKTALMFVDSDAATLAVVDSLDGSVAKILSQNPHNAGADAALTEMVRSLEAEDARPQGLFVVGAGVDVASVRTHLTNATSLPVIASEEPQLALARGAALASANAPRFDTSTIGLAYSLDSGETVLHPMGVAYATTGLLHYDDESTAADIRSDPDDASTGRRPSLMVGSMLTTFAVGVAALAVAMAVNVRPTVDHGPGQTAPHPSELAPAPTIASAQPPKPQPKPAPPSAPIETAHYLDPPAPPPQRVFVNNAGPVPAAPPPAPPAPPPPAVIPWPVLPFVQLPPIGPLWPPQIKAPKNPPWVIGGGKGPGKGPGKGHGKGH